MNLNRVFHPDSLQDVQVPVAAGSLISLVMLLEGVRLAENLAEIGGKAAEALTTRRAAAEAPLLSGQTNPVHLLLKIVA
jgi:hypothetical protein